MKSRPFVLAVTGGIGAGKSTVCEIFSVLGFQVYSADDRAKWLMAHCQELVVAIKETFGEECYSSKGELNRRFLAQRVFNDGEELSKLNALVHPVVKADFESWVGSQREQDIVIKEVALLFENRGEADVDGSLLVSADEDTRIERVLSRDLQRTASEVKAIIGKQMPEKEKRTLADWIIDNDGNSLIIPQVLKIRDDILRGK